MKKKIIKKNYKRIYKKCHIVMIYIIHKILILLKNHLNYLKDSIFKYLFKIYNRLLFFFNNFFHNI